MWNESLEECRNDRFECKVRSVGPFGDNSPEMLIRYPNGGTRLTYMSLGDQLRSQSTNVDLGISSI